MKITFDFAAKRVVIDGAEQDLMNLIAAVRELAPSLPQLTVNAIAPDQASAPPPPPHRQQETPAAGRPATNGDTTTLREFARSLEPDTHAERIAAIAFYVKDREGRAFFAPKDMDSWYLACGFKKPSAMPIALSDAKKVRYVSNSGYGKWEIDRDGENWVIGRLNRPKGDQAA
jgi:hypothetical protein